jgi:hypothetical protein
MNSKLYQMTMIVIIVMYTILVFVNMVLDSDCSNDADINRAVMDLKYLEIALISLFMIEVFVNVGVLGFQVKEVENLTNRTITRIGGI